MNRPVFQPARVAINVDDAFVTVAAGAPVPHAMSITQAGDVCADFGIRPISVAGIIILDVDAGIVIIFTIDEEWPRGTYRRAPRHAIVDGMPISSASVIGFFPGR